MMLPCSCFDYRVDEIIEECLFCQGTGEVILNNDTTIWMNRLRSRIEESAFKLATEYCQLSDGRYRYYDEIDWDWSADQILFSGKDSFGESWQITVPKLFLYSPASRETLRHEMLIAARQSEVAAIEKEKRRRAEEERKERELYAQLRRKYGDGSP